MFHGLNCNLDNLFLLSDAQSRAICAENPTGARGGVSMTASWAIAVYHRPHPL